jgi:hypothetical protein
MKKVESLVVEVVSLVVQEGQLVVVNWRCSPQAQWDLKAQ